MLLLYLWLWLLWLLNVKVLFCMHVFNLLLLSDQVVFIIDCIKTKDWASNHHLHFSSFSKLPISHLIPLSLIPRRSLTFHIIHFKANSTQRNTNNRAAYKLFYYWSRSEFLNAVSSWIYISLPEDVLMHGIQIKKTFFKSKITKIIEKIIWEGGGPRWYSNSTNFFNALEKNNFEVDCFNMKT